MRLAKLSCLCLTGALAVGTSVGVAEAATHLTTFHGSGFSIGLPGKPKRQSLSLGVLGRELLYTVQSSQRAAGIGYLAEPPHTGAADLAASIQGEALGAGGSGAVVHDAVDTTYQGFPARDARITIVKVGGRATIFTRVIDTSKRLYLLVYVITGTSHTKVPPLYAKMRASLVLA